MVKNRRVTAALARHMKGKQFTSGQAIDALKDRRDCPTMSQLTNLLAKDAQFIKLRYCSRANQTIWEVAE